MTRTNIHPVIDRRTVERGDVQLPHEVICAMPTITDEIVIGAPIERVFEYLSKPENHPEIIPSLIAIDNVEELPDGGYEVDVTNQLLGKTFEGHLRDVELEPPNRRVYEIEGDVQARISYSLTSENGSDSVHLHE
jgi:carbon monoxide dehydrogenase subunit G